MGGKAEESVFLSLADISWLNRTARDPRAPRRTRPMAQARRERASVLRGSAGLLAPAAFFGFLAAFFAAFFISAFFSGLGLHGRAGFFGLFADDGVERDEQEADAAATLQRVGGLVKHADVLLIHLREAGVAEAGTAIILVTFAPGLALVARDADGHVVATAGLGVREEQQAAVLIRTRADNRRLADGLAQSAVI